MTANYDGPVPLSEISIIDLRRIRISSYNWVSTVLRLKMFNVSFSNDIRTGFNIAVSQTLWVTKYCCFFLHSQEIIEYSYANPCQLTISDVSRWTQGIFSPIFTLEDENSARLSSVLDVLILRFAVSLPNDTTRVTILLFATLSNPLRCGFPAVIR